MHELQERRKNSIRETVIEMMLIESGAAEKIELKDELIEMIEGLTIEILEG